MYARPSGVVVDALGAVGGLKVLVTVDVVVKVGNWCLCNGAPFAVL